MTTKLALSATPEGIVPALLAHLTRSTLTPCSVSTTRKA